MTCAACGAPYHEATGHVLSTKGPVVLCGPCAKHFVRFVKGQEERRQTAHRVRPSPKDTNLGKPSRKKASK